MVAHLPHESVSGSAATLSLRLPRLVCPRLVEVDGLASVDAMAPDIASAGGTF